MQKLNVIIKINCYF